MKLIKMQKKRQGTKIVNKFVSRVENLFQVAYLDFMKLFDVQQQFFLSQREKGREGCLYRMIIVDFIKQSLTAESWIPNVKELKLRRRIVMTR